MTIVKLAFYTGSKKKVFAVCRLLGISTWETKKRVITLTITERDQITQARLDEANKLWKLS